MGNTMIVASTCMRRRWVLVMRISKKTARTNGIHRKRYCYCMNMLAVRAGVCRERTLPQQKLERLDALPARIDWSATMIPRVMVSFIRAEFRTRLSSMSLPYFLPFRLGMISRRPASGIYLDPFTGKPEWTDYSREIIPRPSSRPARST